MLRHVLAHNGAPKTRSSGILAFVAASRGCLYLVDVDVTAARFVPDDVDIADLMDRYAGFHTKLGNDMQAGLHLAARLSRAGLDVLEFRGRYTIMPVPQGMRGPAWAAREAAALRRRGHPGRHRPLGRGLRAHRPRAAAPDRVHPSFIAIGQKPPRPA